MGISTTVDLSYSPVSTSTTEFLTGKPLLFHYSLFQQEYCKYLDITEQAVIQAKKVPVLKS